ncbi:MAG TPA: 30S ribosomal protein S18 [Chloroflexota bacterium]|nr:30S ribosomal protein S18 [Chloroflexota bacterium]
MATDSVASSGSSDGPSGPSSGGSSGYSGSGGRREGGRPRGRGHYPPRRKVCQFCVEKIDNIDYKDVTRLRRYISDRGKIEPRRKTGTCAKHQRRLSRALKRARQIALLPIAANHLVGFGGWFQPPPFLPPQVAQAPAQAAALAPAPVSAPAPAPAPENPVEEAPAENVAVPDNEAGQETVTGT